MEGFEKALTSEEAGELLQIHPKTVQKWARQGKIPARKFGDLWRFRASELDGWWKSTLTSMSPLVPQN